VPQRVVGLGWTRPPSGIRNSPKGWAILRIPVTVLKPSFSEALVYSHPFFLSSATTPTLIPTINRDTIVNEATFSVSGNPATFMLINPLRKEVDRYDKFLNEWLY
jgi:hypothetical protein